MKVRFGFPSVARAVLVLVGAAFSLMPSAAPAQDTVLMRRPLIVQSHDAFSWTASPWSQCSNSCGSGSESRTVSCVAGSGIVADQYCSAAGAKPDSGQSCTDFSGCGYKWETKSDWTDVKGCGMVVESREMQCRRSDGTLVSRDLCPQPVPDETRSVKDVRTCTFDWTESDWSSWSSFCSDDASRSRSVTCLRSDGTTVDDALCTGTKPPSTEGSSQVSQCGYAWDPQAWSAYDSTCSSTAHRTRTVPCRRSDGTVVADGFCSGSAKPDVTETSAQYGSCSFDWVAGTYGDPAPACGATVATRSVQCRRSNGDIVADASCDPAKKPSATEPRTDYALCSYDWKTGDWSAWSLTCGDATQTRTVSCLSSDGRTVADSFCQGAKPEASQSSHQTSGCSYSWQNDPTWSAPVPACGSTVQNRGVWCLRSDGQTVADASCPAATKPAAQQSATDYSTCTYAWVPGTWGAWSSTCGPATQTRTATCQSSDGRTVADSMCSSSSKPSLSQDAYQTSGCGFSWQSGAYGAAAPACGASTQTRSVTCLRSDGVTVDDGSCPASTKPPVSQPATDYSTCSFSWTDGTWSAPSTTCGSATQTRTPTCLRSDGTTVADASCPAASKPSTSQTTYQTSGCGYSWIPGAWGASNSTCSARAVQTRSLTCQRSDGQTVDASLCPAASQPASSQTVADYSGCNPYYYSASGWSDWSSHCSANATRTMAIGCFRNETDCRSTDQYFWGFHAAGSNDCSKKIPDSNCSVPASTWAGYSPSSGSQTAAVYDQCGYSWQYGAWGAPVAACGATTQSRSVWCLRSDGTTVADSSCPAASKPPTSQGATDYSSCGYSWYQSGWTTTSSTCGSTTQTKTVFCQRSDGTQVTDGFCSAAGTKPPSSQTYTDYSSCSYGWYQSGFSAQTNQCGTANQTQTVYCRRADGTPVGDSYCSGTKPASSVAYTNYNACTYYGGPWWQDWSCNTTCSANASCVEHRTCMRSDGTPMNTGDPCVNSGVPVAQTVVREEYSGCGYNWYQSGFSTPSGCGSVTASQTVFCQRSDGTPVGDGSCAGAKPATTTPSYSTATCGYNASYGGWSACVNSSQSRNITCTRTDGVNVDASACGLPNTQTQSCSSCTATNWTATTCSGGTATATYVGGDYNDTLSNKYGSQRGSGIGTWASSLCAGRGTGCCYIKDVITAPSRDSFHANGEMLKVYFLPNGSSSGTATYSDGWASNEATCM